MKVIHSFHHKRVEKEVETNPGFLLANKEGGYFSLGAKANLTKYNGKVILEDEYFKTIEALHLQEPPAKIMNHFYNVQRKGAHAKESFFFYKNALIYEVDNYTGPLELHLDCRKLYDFHDMGRIYNTFTEDDCIVIEYVKYKTGDLAEEDYRLYIAIAGASYEEANNWLPVEYEYDMQREYDYQPRFVYHALNLNIKDKAEIVFASSTSRQKALQLAKSVSHNIKSIKKRLETNTTTFIHPEFHFTSKINEVAYMSAKNSLYDLLTTLDGSLGIYAGLPWFHQFWARDEAISTGALIKEGMHKQAKNILLRLLDGLKEDGRIVNRFPESELASADSTGWVFTRLFELITSLEANNNLGVIKEELPLIKRKLKYSIQNLLNNHTKDGLAYNNPKETWMDTDYGNDTREGYRIEIQALRLNMYKFMAYLCHLEGDLYKKRKYTELEEITRKKVKETFYHGYLYDGKDDPALRPNLFLAYYVYPELLSTKEWQKCFNFAIKKLWLDWGGFSTIDKESPLFTPHYTGENNQSYHRGDSWFFLNNIAAISLLKVNSRRYKKYIEKIFNASREDILFKGVIGHHSELSSAQEQKAEGSLVQAWSAATFMEFVNSLRVYKLI
ncbi:MAG: amylo-alpha-1,6-glucosidase [Candidatus Nanoarchaeia archaeon]